jgi:hypothetical protein
VRVARRGPAGDGCDHVVTEGDHVGTEGDNFVTEGASMRYTRISADHLPPDAVHKITCENAGKFYGLIP